MKLKDKIILASILLIGFNNIAVNAANSMLSGNTLLLPAKQAESNKCYYTASEIYSNIYVNDYKDMAIDKKIPFLKDYAEVCIQLNEYGKAIELYNRLLKIVLKYNGLNSNEAIDVQSNLAFLKAKLTRLNKGYVFREKDLLTQSLYVFAVREKEEELKLNPINNPSIINLFKQTKEEVKQKNYKLAVDSARSALAAIEKNYGAKSIAMTFGLVNLAYVYSNQGLFRRSEAIYEKIIKIDDSIPNLSALIKAEHLRNYGWVNYFLHQYSESHQYLTESINLKESILPPDSFVLIMSYADLARLYMLEEKYEQSDALYKGAIKLCDKNPKAVKAKPALLKNYANLLLEMGRYSEADDVLAKAYLLEDKNTPKLK